MHLKYLYILLIYGSIQVIDGVIYPVCNSRIECSDYVLHALERLLSFLESDAINLNLDGLYGIRIAQGQLNVLQQIITLSVNKSSHWVDRNNLIHSLSSQIERLANISLSEILIEDASYYNRFSVVVLHPFAVDYRSRQVNKHLIQQGSRDPQMPDDMSDNCFTELFGTLSNHTNSSKCFVSRLCWNMMTSPTGQYYRLTHQLLWFLIAKSISCIHVNLANEHLNYLEDYFCSNMYEDAKVNLAHSINQDLFLEQLLLCSIIGYEEFLRLDWLNRILTWQHPYYDCFSDTSETVRFHHNTNRRLLSEQQMNNGCLSHKSGLAAGLLATYAGVFLGSSIK